MIAALRDMIDITSVIFAPNFAAGPQKAGRSREGAAERDRTIHRKVVFFLKPQVL